VLITLTARPCGGHALFGDRAVRGGLPMTRRSPCAPRALAAARAPIMERNWAERDALAHDRGVPVSSGQRTDVRSASGCARIPSLTRPMMACSPALRRRATPAARLVAPARHPVTGNLVRHRHRRYGHGPGANSAALRRAPVWLAASTRQGEGR
jgi:hypothetical protein